MTLTRQVVENLIDQPAELDAAILLLKYKGITLNRLTKELQKSTVAFWYWRHGRNPIPRHVGLFFWFNYGLGKEQVWPFMIWITTFRDFKAAVELIREKHGDDLSETLKDLKAADYKDTDQIPFKLRATLYKLYRVGKKEVADFLDRKSATPVSAAA